MAVACTQSLFAFIRHTFFFRCALLWLPSGTRMTLCAFAAFVHINRKSREKNGQFRPTQRLFRSISDCYIFFISSECLFSLTSNSVESAVNRHDVPAVAATIFVQ